MDATERPAISDRTVATLQRSVDAGYWDARETFLFDFDEDSPDKGADRNPFTLRSNAVRDTDGALDKTDPGYDQVLINNIYARRIAYVAGHRNHVLARAAGLENSLNPKDKKKRAELLKRGQNLLGILKTRYPSEREEAQQMLINEQLGRP